MFGQLGVQRAILIGDLVTDRVRPESSLDLIMVLDIPGNFTRRMDFLPAISGLRWPPTFWYTFRKSSELWKIRAPSCDAPSGKKDRI